MLCADTNVWVAFLQGDQGEDIDLLHLAMRFDQVAMAPPVLTELLTDPKLPQEDRRMFIAYPLMNILPGFWERAGDLRATLVKHGNKPKLADSLIAQFCIDHRIQLLTRDKGFRAFAKHGGLTLAK